MARTRSASAHQKVIEAAAQLVAEQGVDATSMDAIAGRSGVSKATIYKHWQDKDALLLEMMCALHGFHERPAFDTGNTRPDMIAVLAYRRKENSEMRERILPHFVAYSARNQEFGQAWRDLVMEPPRRELRHLIQSGIEKKELRRGIDMDTALAMLLGPILYWHMFQKRVTREPLQIAEAVVDAFWRAFGVTGRR